MMTQVHRMERTIVVISRIDASFEERRGEALRSLVEIESVVMMLARSGRVSTAISGFDGLDGDMSGVARVGD